MDVESVLNLSIFENTTKSAQSKKGKKNRNFSAILQYIFCGIWSESILNPILKSMFSRRTTIIILIEQRNPI